MNFKEAKKELLSRRRQHESKIEAINNVLANLAALDDGVTELAILPERGSSGDPPANKPAKKPAGRLPVQLKTPSNLWTPEDDKELKKLTRKKVPAKEIATYLGRTERSVFTRRHKLGITRG